MNMKLGKKAVLAGLCACWFGSAAAGSAHFAKVPSDTPLYIGTAANDDWLTSMGLGDPDALRSVLSRLAKGKASDSEQLGDDGLFLQVLAEALLQGGEDGENLILQPGRVQFYLHGAAPVLRLQLSSGKQLQSYLSQQAAKKGADIQSATIQSQDMWIPTGPRAEVFASIDGDDLVLARWSQGPGYPTFKEVVAGGEGFDPADELLPAMAKYNLSGSTVGWLNLAQLQQSVVNPDNAVHKAIAASVTNKAQWQQFLSEPCQADVSRYINSTPHMLGAVQHKEVDGQRHMQSAFVVPMRDDKARAAWQSVQGQVLADADNAAPIRFGLGVNGTGMSSFVNYIAADFAALQCPLWRDHAAKAGVGLAMASSMSAMFSSVKGLTAQLFDFELDAQNNPVPDTVDAQLTVLTDSPSLLLLMLRSALTLPANIPQDGTPVTVDTPIGVPVQLAVYPHSINVFKGAQASGSVAAMDKSVPTDSAVMGYVVDLLWAMTKAAENTPGKSPQELLRESGADAMMPISMSGGVKHLPYGMRVESNAIYAEPEGEEAPAPTVVKASN